MSSILWLIFLCHMQWGEFRFMYKLCGENQCSRRNLGHVFPFVSHTYSAFKFFMWTQQFWNPKHPDMGWIGEFYRRCDKENPAWFGSIFTLIEATDPPKPLFIANGQTRKCIQKLLLCLCGNLYNFSQFFCFLFVFWENFTLQLINLKSEQDSKTFALWRIVHRPNPEEHWLQPCFSCRASACASVSQHAALLSCRLHSTKTFVSELYFQPEPTFAPQTRQLQGLCLTFGKEFAAQHIIKNFASRPFSPNAFPFTSIFILNAPMQLQDI